MSTEVDPEIDDAFFMDDAILRDPSNDPTPQPTPQPTTNSNAYTQSPSRLLTLFPTKSRVSSTEAPSDSPTFKPTAQPSKALSNVPSQAPSFKPSPAPSPDPTFQPSTLPSINTGTRTYLSCPAPAPRTFEGIDKDGNTVIIQLDQPVSTIPVGFIFEVTESSSSSASIEGYLPEMQSELGGSLASYLQEHFSENENETSTSCDGYSVETMTRHLQEYDGQAEDTKILSITSTIPFTTTDQACTTPSPSCSVVEGSYDVTYVGTNEAAVETVIYKAMMEEVENLPPNNDFEAEVSYSHQHNNDGHIRLPPVIQKIGNDFMDAVPESEEGFLPNTTIYGKLFLGLLGGAFLMIIFVVFRSNDKGKKDKDEDDEDKDGEDVSKEGSNSDTCSDGLEDLVIDDGSFDCEQQVVDGNTSPDDSAMTPRISNTAATDILADLERSEEEDEVGTEEGSDALASLFTELEENTESVEIDLQSTLRVSC